MLTSWLQHGTIGETIAMSHQHRTADQGASDGPLSDQTALRIRIGFLLFIAGGLISSVIAIVSIFVSLRGDVVQMLTKVDAQQIMLNKQQEMFQAEQLEMQQFKDQLGFLRLVCPAASRLDAR